MKQHRKNEHPCLKPRSDAISLVQMSPIYIHKVIRRVNTERHIFTIFFF